MEDIEPLVEGSLEGAERVSEIVQNLRSFTTPQESKQQDFDLIPVLKRATSWVLKTIASEPEIVTDYPDKLPLFSNEGYVHQILINLLQNAIDAVSKQKDARLEISVLQDAQHNHIQIHDNGPGISEENLVKIFDPFFTTKSVGSGTGLGLYISYGLATEQCRGNLTASNHVDGGAVFVLSLPKGNSDG